MTTATPPHVVVVGGGIAGLAAAFFLRDQPVRVTVLEGSPRLGGKLSASEVAGVPMDEGAEALLARRPEGVELITATGLGNDLVPAGVTSSAVYTRGELRPLPRKQFMGVPADIDELAATGVVSAEGIGRARHESRLSPETGDVSVTRYIGARLGEEVVDRLVDPLLGGVYAGRSEELSFQATLAPLAAAAAKHPTLTEAAASLIPAAPSAHTAGPVFVTLTTGLGALPDAIAKASGAEVRTGAMVRELTRTESGWRLTVGSAADPEYLADFPDQGRSGYLVPAIDGKAVKAVTFSTVKWPHLAERQPVHIVRCSIGRIGETALLQRDDKDLAALAAAELAEAAGITAASVAHRVTRWGGALPQYNVGHLDRVAAIRAAIEDQPGLAVAGAAYDGVGIPACVATARSAAGQIVAYLARATAGPREPGN